MSNWQPIDTAPQDGTPILVYQPQHERESDLFADRRITTLDEEIYVCKWDGNSWVEAQGEQYERFFPTHWMPLPKPPA